MIKSLLMRFRAKGAEEFARDLYDVAYGYAEVGAEAKRAGDKAKRAADDHRKTLETHKGATDASTSSTARFADRLKTLGKGGAAGLAAAGVAFLSYQLIEFAEQGADAIRVAQTFHGDIEALRAASAGVIDDTTLQRFDKLAEKIKLTSGELEDAILFATQRFSEGYGESAAKNVEMVLNGEKEGLRKLGLVIDDTTEKYQGMSEAQKKVQFARDAAAEGARVGADAINDEALAVERARTALDNFISDMQVFVFQTLESSGAFDVLNDAMQAAKGFFEDNRERIERLADVAIRLADVVLETLFRRMDDGSLVLDSLIVALELLTDVLEEIQPAIDMLIAPFDALTGGFRDLIALSTGLEGSFEAYDAWTANVESYLERINRGASRAARGIRDLAATNQMAMEAREAFGSGALTASTLSQARMIQLANESYSDMYDASEALFEAEVARYEGMFDSESKLAEMRDLAYRRNEERQAHLATYYDTMIAKEEKRTAVAKERVDYEAKAAGLAGAFVTGAATGAASDGVGMTAAEMLRAGVGVRAGGGAGYGFGDPYRGAPIMQGADARGVREREAIGGARDAADGMRDAREGWEDFRDTVGEPGSNPIAQSMLEVVEASELVSEAVLDASATIAQAWADVDAGLMSSADAWQTSLGAAVSAGKVLTGAFVDDKQTQAGIMAAFEIAQSISDLAFGNYQGAFLHALSATKFGLIAAGGGSAGGGASAASAGRSQASTAAAAVQDRKRESFARESMFRNEREQSQVHYHVHTLQAQTAYDMITGTLNKGARRRVGRGIDPTLIEPGRWGGL